MQKCCFILFLITVTGLSGKIHAQTNNEGMLLFNSGFEPNTRLIPLRDDVSTDKEITGTDLSVGGPNDWVKDIDENPLLGDIYIQFQGGDSSMRYARIIEGPQNPENHVLQFWTNGPNVEGRKTRIQANLFEHPGQNMPGIYELYQSVRVYLPEDMGLLKSYPDKIGWLTIFEVWNNLQWMDDPYPFRITVGMGKDTENESELHFHVGAEDYEYPAQTGRQRGRYIKIWHEMNKSINVPIGQWFTLEYYVKEGNGETGRFYMLITTEDGKKQVLFDIHNFTHNTKDPNPDGITLWNPLKLYTSKNLVNYMRENGSALEILWDDFSVWKGKVPEAE
ncbi:MAG: hypothetical protein ACOC1J_01670 [Prolixibacteraceae bacterium]